MVCRNIPQGAADGFETLPEMYLGLGVQRNAATGTAQGATHDVPAQGIDLSALRKNREALECFNNLIRTNPSLLNNTASALRIIRHFQTTDGIDPNHITWGELTRDYGENAEAVAHQLNAYLGIVTFLSQSSDRPAFPAQAPAGGACPNVTAQALSSYEDLTQAYVGLGLERDPATGVARRPSSSLSASGVDLSVLDDGAAVGCLENMARNNPALLRDLRRVQQILQGLRDTDSQNQNTLTPEEIQSLYGENAGHALVSIHSYLGLLHHVSGRTAPSGGQDSGVNPWVAGGIAGGTVVLGALAYFGLRNRSGSSGGNQAVEQQIREMQQDAARVQPQQAAVPSPPPPPPPPLPAVEAVHPAIILPDRAEGRWVIGRGAEAEGVIRLSSDPSESGYSRISRQHALISRDGDGRVFIQDLGSLNGTTIFRDDPVAQECRRIDVGREPFEVRPGDVINLGGMSIGIDNSGLTPAIVRLDMSEAEIQGSRIEPLRISSPERQLIDRLRDAQRGNVEVEIFMREPNARGNVKEKYVTRVVSVRGQGDAARVEVQFGNNMTRTFRLDQILTVRERGGEDLSSRYIHPNLADPQFRDRSVNLSGVDGSGMGVLVDYSDPRLTNFLDEYIRPIRERLDRGELTQRQAAEAVWRVVRDYVPYDYARIGPGANLPNRLYRLGDFIETGVCNERSMLVQVSLQYVGVDSQLEKGPFGGGRHAWVRGYFSSSTGGHTEAILDPQAGRTYEAGRDAKALNYRDDGTRFAQPKVGTVVMNGDALAAANAELLRRAAPQADAPAPNAPAQVVRTGWEEVLTYRVNDEAVFNALERMDPQLARYYREHISSSAAPVGSMGDLVNRISMIHPQALDGALRSASLEGRSITQCPERAIFELVTQSAEGRRMWSDPDPTTRAARAASFENHARNAGVLERDGRGEVRREDQRERERRERERLDPRGPRR